MAINVGTLQAILKIEDKGVDATLARVMKGLKAIPEVTTLKIDADVSGVESAAGAARTALAGIQDEQVAITGDATDALGAASGLEAELAGIGDEGVSITGDASDALAAASAVRAELAGISDEGVVVTADASDALAAAGTVRAELASISDEAVVVNVDARSALGEVQSVEASLAGLEDQTVRVNIEAENLSETLSGLGGGGLGAVSGAADGAGGSLADAAVNAGAFGGALDLADGKAGKLAKSGLALLGGVGIAAGLNSAANAAGDLAESVNVVGLQFGDLNDEFLSFTADAPRSLGLSTRAANELGGGIQGLLTGMGIANDESAEWSKTLLTLGADMGSAFNKEPAEAIQAIGGALRGETEPIRAFNVMLDAASIEAKAMEMGLAGATGEVDKAGKAQATMALIMESTNKIQGDFANTADGLANSQRTAAGEIENASAQIGESLAPALAKAYGMVAGLASEFGDLPGPVQTGILAMLGIGAVAPLIGHVAGGIGGLNEKLRNTGPAGATAAGALSKVGSGLAIAGLAYAAAQGLDALITKLNTSGLSAANFEGQLLSIAESGAGVGVTAHILGTDIDGLIGKFEAADTSVGSMLNVFDGISGKARMEAAPAIAELDARLAGLAARGPEGAAAAKVLYDQIANTVGVDLAKERLSLYGATVDEAKLSSDLAAPAAAALGDEAVDLAADMDAVKEALDKAIDSLKTLHGEMNAGLQSEIVYEAAIDSLNETLAINGRTTDISTEAGRNNVNQAMVTGEAIIGLAEKYLREGYSVEEATAKTNTNIDALARQLRQAGWTEDQVAGLIDTINLTPQDVQTIFETPGLREGINAVQGLHNEIKAVPKMIRVAFNVSGISGGAVRNYYNSLGDGPGGPMAPKGGRALDRVRAILPAYPGLRVTSTYRSPAHNRRVGGSPTSYHLDARNPAVDVAGPGYQMNRFYGALGSGWREKLHEGDHVHVAHTGGEVASWWPKTAGLRWDERMAILQLGENVVPAGVSLPEQRVTMPASRTYASAGRGGSAGPTIINVYPQGSVITTRDIARDLRPFLGD